MMDVVFPQDEYCLAIEVNASSAIPHVCPFFEEAKITYSIGTYNMKSYRITVYKYDSRN